MAERKTYASGFEDGKAHARATSVLLAKALMNLVDGFMEGRFYETMNPYRRPEVEQALKALAEAGIHRQTDEVIKWTGKLTLPIPDRTKLVIKLKGAVDEIIHMMNTGADDLREVVQDDGKEALYYINDVIEELSKW